LKSRRVVVTGLGIVSPLANTREETWQNLLAGGSGAGAIKCFDASTWPTKVACEVKGFALAENAFLPAQKPYLSRPLGFGMQAAFEAMGQSRLILSKEQRGRFGVCVGSGIGGIDLNYIAERLREHKEEVVVPRSDSANLLQNHPGTFAGLLSERWQAQGPVATIHTACASSGQAIGQAFREIKNGDADFMLSGGADSLGKELLLAGFCLIGAVTRSNAEPTSASRPFDRLRDGFVAGEGAAMLVLEEREHALARGAFIYGEIKGYGETESAYRITDLPPDGRGIVEAMELAIAEAKIVRKRVHYINAHGTSTEVNDRIEAVAIRRVFGEHGAAPMISSTKSATGHLISAAGALEAAFCLLAIRDQAAPPTLNLHDTDCGDDLDFIKLQARYGEVDAAISNSIGFGGSNSSLLFARHSL